MLEEYKWDERTELEIQLMNTISRLRANSDPTEIRNEHFQVMVYCMTLISKFSNSCLEEQYKNLLKVAIRSFQLLPTIDINNRCYVIHGLNLQEKIVQTYFWTADEPIDLLEIKTNTLTSINRQFSKVSAYHYISLALNAGFDDCIMSARGKRLIQDRDKK